MRSPSKFNFPRLDDTLVNIGNSAKKITVALYFDRYRCFQAMTLI